MKIYWRVLVACSALVGKDEIGRYVNEPVGVPKGCARCCEDTYQSFKIVVLAPLGQYGCRPPVGREAPV